MLNLHGITHVINCAGLVCGNYHPNRVDYTTFFLLDSAHQDIIPLFYETRLLIDDVRASGGRTFIHCHQGVSRSATVVIAYIMACGGLSYDEAFRFVRSIRGVTSPNTGFICQLMEFQKQLQRAGDLYRRAGVDQPRPIPMGTFLSSNEPKLFRISPLTRVDSKRLVARAVECSAESLDPRAVFVLQDTRNPPYQVFVFAGPKTPAALQRPAIAAALRFCTYLTKYECMPAPWSVSDYGDADGTASWLSFCAALQGIVIPSNPSEFELEDIKSTVFVDVPQSPMELPQTHVVTSDIAIALDAPESVAGQMRAEVGLDRTPQTEIRAAAGVLTPRGDASDIEESDVFSECGAGVLYVYDADEWDTVLLFDSDDLVPDTAVALVHYESCRVVVWVGEDWDPAGGLPSELAESFRETFGRKLSESMITITDEDDDEPPEGTEDEFVFVLVEEVEPDWLLDLLDDE